MLAKSSDPGNGCGKLWVRARRAEAQGLEVGRGVGRSCGAEPSTAGWGTSAGRLCHRGTDLGDTQGLPQNCVMWVAGGSPSLETPAWILHYVATSRSPALLQLRGTHGLQPVTRTDLQWTTLSEAIPSRPLPTPRLHAGPPAAPLNRAHPNRAVSGTDRVLVHKWGFRAVLTTTLSVTFP